MAVKIPVTANFKDNAFPQLSKQQKEAQAQATRMRKLQERHAAATLRETKEQIAQHNRVLSLSKKLERQFEQERKEAEKARKAAERDRRPGLKEQIGGAVGEQLVKADLLSRAVDTAKQFTLESLAAGDAAIATARTFDNLSGSSEAAAANLAAMNRATRDLVSEQEQQAIANQLLGMNIATNATELEKVVSVSRRLGKEFKGLGAREAAEEFALMVSNMSVQRLDSFGISSGAVRARIDELMASTEGMTREQAFFQAAMGEADKTLARLGPEVGNQGDKVAELQARYADFQAEVGELILKLGDAGLFDALINVTELLASGAEAWQAATDNIGWFSDAVGSVGLAMPASIDEIKNFGQSLLDIINPLSLVGTGVSAFIASLQDGRGFLASWQDGMEAQGQLFGDLVVDTIKLVTSEEELAQAFAATATQAEQQATAIATNAQAVQEVSEAVRDAARELIDIDEQAAEDRAEAWADYYDRLGDLGRDSAERLAEIEADSAGREIEIQEDLVDDILKNRRDLGRDLKKLARDLSKDLEKLEKDTNKGIRRAQEDYARDRRNKEKMRKVDALADERLFQFGLRQLEAEGQGNAIAAALEQREIEQQIAEEKATAEQQIEDEKHQTDLDRMREDASDRARQLEEEAEERRQQLEEEAAERQRALEQAAAEEEQQRQADLAQALADEQASFEERRGELGEFVDEKINKIEEGKKKAISALAAELAETGDMTEDELSQLVAAAGRFGQDAGEAFAEGLRQGAEAVRQLDELIPSSPGGGRGLRNPGGSGGPGGETPRGFQLGGSFVVGGSGGPDSQLVQFMATPGEPVTVGKPGTAPGQMPPITINAHGVAAEALASILQAKVEEGFEVYHEQVIKPWAAGM